MSRAASQTATRARCEKGERWLEAEARRETHKVRFVCVRGSSVEDLCWHHHESNGHTAIEDVAESMGVGGWMSDGWTLRHTHTHTRTHERVRSVESREGHCTDRHPRRLTSVCIALTYVYVQLTVQGSPPYTMNARQSDMLLLRGTLPSRLSALLVPRKLCARTLTGPRKMSKLASCKLFPG
jgi:hypothetical protein